MKLYVLDLGKIVMVGDNPVTKGGGAGEPPAIPIHAFLLDTPKGKLLFDTGCAPGCMEGVWPAASCVNPYVESASLTERLAQAGVRPEEIRCVVLSHLHLDHAGGVHLFPNAEVLVQSGELDRVMEDARRDTLGMFHLRCDVDNWARSGVKWNPVKEERLTLCEGVTVLNLGPGHSFGMLALLVELAAGKFLLVSDAVYSAAHYGPPAQLSGYMENEQGYFSTIERLRALAQETGAQVLYGHDMAQFQTLKKSPAEWYE